MKKRNFINLSKRCFCLLLSCLLVMTTLSNDVKRADAAASVVIGSSALSLLADFLMSIGVVYSSVSAVRQASISVSDYIDEKKAAALQTGKTTIKYREDGVAVGGAGRTFDISTADLTAAKNLLDGTTSITPGMLIPAGVMGVFRAFGNERLNISSIDSASPSSFTYYTADEYYNSFPCLPTSWTSPDGGYSVTSSAPIWNSQSWSNIFSKSPFILTIKDFKKGTTYTTFTTVFDHPGSNGFFYTPYNYLTNSNEINNYIADFLWFNRSRFITFPDGYDYGSANYGIKNSYSNPTIDIPWASSPLLWNGVTDISKTIDNQVAAKTEADKKTYVENTITPDRTAVKQSYATLNYILGILARYFGASAVTAVINDAFIADFYKTYVKGSAVEKYDQADGALDNFTVITGTGGDNNKNFKVLNILVNAYLACLIKNALVPSSTIQPVPDTQIENIVVKETMEPAPDPTPDPTPNPGIDLSGVLDWLNKIYTAILAMPTNIVAAVKAIPAALTLEITKVGEWIKAIPSTFTTQFNNIKEWINALPSTFASSQFGQWLKSIPGILTDIGADIKNMPSTLIDIKNAIVGLPDLFITKIKTFFTIDHVQVDAAVQGVTTAFTGKFSALKQITDVFDKQNYTFSNTIPVIKMQTPDVFKPAIKTEQIIILDLRPYKDIFAWCRLLLTAFLWVAFGKWVIDQFDVDFHIG